MQLPKAAPKATKEARAVIDVFVASFAASLTCGDVSPRTAMCSPRAAMISYCNV